ncbi:MAG: tetratricopeptide repeat protein [Armatimonadota bacterium]|nr:tetratricopeptide repeat protein [Armatimonadota bacterium]
MLRKQQWLWTALLVWLALVPRLAKAAPAPLATVRTVVGDAWLGKKANPLKRRQSLYAGNIVGTGANGKATLLFSDGAQTRLGANTTIEVVNPAPVGNGKQSLFRVIGGEMWSRLRPGNAIQTRTVALGVRGTEIHLKVAEDDGTTTLTVVEGEVDFWNEFGAVVVGASQQSVARAGAAPTAPVTVQNAGLIIEWTLDLDRAAIPHEKFFVSLDPRTVAAELAQRDKQAQATPDDANARRAYGDALFDSRKFEAALKEYEAANRLAPDQPATLTHLGYALLELDRLSEAANSFRAALGVESSPRVLLASLDVASARTEFIPASATAYAPALTGLAWLALEHDRPALAQVAAEQAVVAQKNAQVQTTSTRDGIEANTAEAQIALGVALMRQPGHLADATQAIEAALGSEPAEYHYQARAWMALAYLAQNDFDGALRAAQQATQLQPHSALAHGNQALVHFFRGEANKAQREAQIAVDLNPEAPTARVALGQALLARGDVDAANRVAAQAVALDPQLPQARYLLGVANASRRDYRHAEAELKEGLRLAPDFLPAASALARVYNGMGRQQDAVVVLTELLPRHRQADAVLGALGAVYYEQGKFNEAQAKYREALKKKPNSALYHAELARTLVYHNQLKEAIDAARTAVHLAPNVGQYHAILGLAYDFSRLDSQAEREFRTALTFDPQNALALAQLAYKHTGTDLRPAASSFTQAFMQDPAVSQQLLRGGINTEVTPQGGSDGQKNISLTQRLTAADGKLHSFGFVNRLSDDGRRNNDDSTAFDLAQFMTYVPGPRTNLYLTLRHTRTEQGLTGSESSPTFDDRSNFRFGDAQIAARQRLGNGRYLWLGVRGNTSRSTLTDSGMNSFTDIVTGLPTFRQRFNSSAVVPEMRMDFALNQATSRSGVFSLGVAQAQTRFDRKRDLIVPIGSGLVESNIEEKSGTFMAYGQLAQRFGERVSLIAQLRAQHLDTTQLVTVPLPRVQPLFMEKSRTYVLPSLLATYQSDKRTTLRLSLNRRVTDVTASAFAPNETLLTTQASALPFGTPETMNLAQVDVERYFGSDNFLKLFLFRTTANNLLLGGTDLLGFGNGLSAATAPVFRLGRWEGRGAGFRYERRLGHSLFANLGYTLRHTSADGFASAPYEPKHLGSIELNHVSGSGNKIGVRLRHVGSLFQDSPGVAGRASLGAQNYIDVLLAREVSANNEFFVNITNLFDKTQVQFYDFPTGQRQIQFGMTRRF